MTIQSFSELGLKTVKGTMSRELYKLYMCREGYFILPYNELAIAQGPKIQQKNEL